MSYFHKVANIGLPSQRARPPPLGILGPGQGAGRNLGAGVTFAASSAPQPSLGFGGDLQAQPFFSFSSLFFSCSLFPWLRGLIAAQTFNSDGN